MLPEIKIEEIIQFFEDLGWNFNDLNESTKAGHTYFEMYKEVDDNLIGLNLHVHRTNSTEYDLYKMEEGELKTIRHDTVPHWRDIKDFVQ